ncbi:hypothetical protein [Parathalassolituus penaei]|uniref:DUF11 domain-containing protein n=1 Tax=Parathalassolituus penaei TaxID=2997323 RepID=A0A9X3IRE1_9GAMM|nr:hypothetical protein [Parathalassolituus penaei]MCY0963744.1 hypothetical protein [Parathalassolituus penaei]
MKLQKALWLPAVVAALSGVSTANAGSVSSPNSYTDAGTKVSNTASVSYAVGGTNQTDVDSNTATFLVDVKVNFVVDRVETSPYTVSNGGTTKTVAAYTISNLGNAPMSFLVTKPVDQATNTTVSYPTPVADTIDFPSSPAFSFTGSGDTTLGNGDDATLTAVGSHYATILVQPDETYTVYVTMTDAGFVGVDADIASLLTTVYGYKASYSSDGTLAATEHDVDTGDQDPTNGSTATSGSDNINAVDIVYADVGRNNTETVDNAVELDFPFLAIVKTSQVISDPINGTTNPKAIPGAVVEYSLEVQNWGGAAAAGINLSDAIPANTTYVANSTELDSVAVTDTGTMATTVEATIATLAAATVPGHPAGYPTPTSTATGTPTTKTVTFRVTIN